MRSTTGPHEPSLHKAENRHDCFVMEETSNQNSCNPSLSVQDESDRDAFQQVFDMWLLRLVLLQFTDLTVGLLIMQINLCYQKALKRMSKLRVQTLF